MLNSKLRAIFLSIGLFAAGAALAAPFDGSEPLECLADNGYDCLPGQDSCGRLKPVTRIEPIFRINFASKKVRSPYRTQMLTVSHTTSNPEALVIQGADQLFAWSALIHKDTGVIKIAVADSQGAYVVFGKCKSAPKPAMTTQERLNDSN